MDRGASLFQNLERENNHVTERYIDETLGLKFTYILSHFYAGINTCLLTI